MPLLDLFWSMLWFFLFFTWIWIAVSVLLDIFRSPNLRGVTKAIWVVFVAFLPVLGVHGVIEAVVAIADSNTPNRGLQITAGVIGAIAGIVILSYPISSIFTLAVILGIWLLMYGVMEMVLAFRLRRVAHAGTGPIQPATA